MKTIILISSLFFCCITFTSCKKEGCTNHIAKNYDPEATKDNGSCIYGISHQLVLENIGNYVISYNYSYLSYRIDELFTYTQNFANAPSAGLLSNIRSDWKGSQTFWEQTAAFHFGPVSFNNIDSKIDTWPIDVNSIEAEIGGSLDFTVDANIEVLNSNVKGLHAIEYLLFGVDGTKTYSDFTSRELEYLVALTKNLKNLIADVALNWSTSSPSSFYNSFIHPNSTNNYYTTNLSAFEDLINSMITICDQVANVKIGEPYFQQNLSLVESAFSNDSKSVFLNNIRSVKNIYLGTFNQYNVTSIEDIVKEDYPPLNTTIRDKIENAIQALYNITEPFEQAITTQAPEVQNAIDAINDLKETLNNELLPFIQATVTD